MAHIPGSGSLRDWVAPRLVTERVLAEQSLDYDDLELWYGRGSDAASRKLALFQELTVHHHMMAPEPTFFASCRGESDVRKLADLWRKQDDSKLLSLYVHVPFCHRRRCAYCMYHSRVLSSTSSHAELDAYLTTVDGILANYSPAFRGRTFNTLYLGGGTPSLLHATHLDRLLSSITTHLSLAGRGERTSEVSPHTVTRDKLTVLRSHGINRISMGVQSLVPEILRTEGRVWTAPERIREVASQIMGLGFTTLNTDLMLGLRGDDGSGVLQSFEQLAGLRIPSITVYSRRTVPEISSTHTPSLDYAARREVVQRLVAKAEALGYTDAVRDPALECQHFVLSGHLGPLPEYRTRYSPIEHNSCLGIGEGAASFIADRVRVECKAAADGSEPTYIVVESSERDRMRAFIVNRLYENGELDEIDLANRFRRTFSDAFTREIHELETLRLARYDGHRFILTSSNAIGRATALKFFYRPAYIFEQLCRKREGTGQHGAWPA